MIVDFYSSFFVSFFKTHVFSSINEQHFVLSAINIFKRGQKYERTFGNQGSVR
jgi:hypothetical protein